MVQRSLILANTCVYYTCWFVGRGSVSSLVSNSISSRALLVAVKEFCVKNFAYVYHYVISSRQSLPPSAKWTTSLVAADSSPFNGANTASHQIELTRSDAILYHFVQYLTRKLKDTLGRSIYQLISFLHTLPINLKASELIQCRQSEKH